ncbi:MAG: hypothetical protein IM607_12460 [Cytophagales bacterium]|nr:hypothetical protein [Cytophagales bacterium]
MAKIKTIRSNINSVSLKSNFEKLISVIRAMKPEEVKIASNYILFGHNTKYKGVTGALFDCLLTNPSITADDVRVKLGGISKSALEMAVIRLKEKLNFSLISEFSTLRDGAYSERYQSFFTGKYLIMQYHILYKRGALHEAYDKIQRCVEISKKYEWFDNLIEALYLQIEYLSKISEFNIIDEIEKEIVYFELCRRNERKIRSIYDLILAEDKKITSEIERIEIYRKNIEYIEQIKEGIITSLSKYILLILKVNYSVLTQHFVNAEEYAQKLLSLTSNTPALNQPDLTGIAAIFLAESLIPQRRYAEALNYTWTAKNNFTKYSINYGETLELEYIIQINSGKPQLAAEIACELSDTKNYAVTPYHKNRRLYMWASAEFANGNYTKSNDILMEIGNIHYDKAGWKIGIRLLQLLLFKQLEDYASIDKYLQTWKRDMASMRKHIAMRKRDIRLFNIIYRLLKSVDSWQTFVKSNKDELMELILNDELKWRPGSHELIDVSLWIYSKGLRKPYSEVQLTQLSEIPVSAK